MSLCACVRLHVSVTACRSTCASFCECVYVHVCVLCVNICVCLDAALWVSFMKHILFSCLSFSLFLSFLLLLLLLFLFSFLLKFTNICFATVLRRSPSEANPRITAYTIVLRVLLRNPEYAPELLQNPPSRTWRNDEHDFDCILIVTFYEIALVLSNCRFDQKLVQEMKGLPSVAVVDADEDSCGGQQNLLRLRLVGSIVRPFLFFFN